MTMYKAVDAIKLKFTLTDGAAANTNITVAGIATEDTLIGVQEFEAETGTYAPTDRTSEASITSAGYIQLSTTTTASDKLLVIWHDASLPALPAGKLKATLCTGNATQMTCAGIATEDSILFALEWAVTTSAVSDITSTCSITEAGKVDVSSTTADDLVLVIWIDRSAPGPDSWCFKWGQCNGSATTSTLTGIATIDELFFVIELNQTHYVPTDRTSTTTISAADTLTNGTSTENDKLLVMYHDKGV